MAFARDTLQRHGRARRNERRVRVFALGDRAGSVILGVDELMDMARTTVNLVGNCLATAVMARWEGEFNEAAAMGLAPPAQAA